MIDLIAYALFYSFDQFSFSHIMATIFATNLFYFSRENN